MSYKIAILEDDQLLLKALTIELGTEFEVVSATNGQSGIELINNEMPDLILLDIIMPIKNGFQVLEEIKADEKVKDIPVIMITNLSEEEEKEKSMKLGAIEYFVKSATKIKAMKDMINNILDKYKK